MDIFNLFNRKKSINLQQFYTNQMAGFGSLTSNFLSENSSFYYDNIPELRGIIDRQASMFLNIDAAFTDKSGKEISTRETDKFNFPNPFQDKQEFLTSAHKIFNLSDILVVYLHGFNGQYFTKDVDIYIFNIDDLYIELNKFNDVPLNFKEIVKKVEANVFWSDKRWNLNKGNLFFINSSGVSSKNLMLTNQKIKSAQKPLSNLASLYESENVIIKNRGAVGIFSPQTPKDGYGISIGDETKETENQLNQYGTLKGQNKWIVSKSPINFIRTELTPTQLGFYETKESSIDAICAVWQHSPLLLKMQGATFANIDASKADLYENKIIPDAKILYDAFNSNIFYNNTFKISYNFDNIASLSESNLKNSTQAEKNVKIVIDLNYQINNGYMSYQNAVDFLISSGLKKYINSLRK